MAGSDTSGYTDGLADTADAVAAGLRPAMVSGLPPGRACLAGDGRELQLAQPADPVRTVSAVAKHWGLIDVAVRPPDIRCLPTLVREEDLPAPAISPVPAPGDDRPPVALPIGIDGETLRPALLELHPGDHLLVAGATGAS